MPEVTPSEPSQPRVIAPTYAFDPNGIYADPHVQAWATHYANGGTDLAGASYFISIPGLTDNGPETVQSPVRENVPLVPSAPVAPPSPEDPASALARPHGPRNFQARPKQRSKGLLGLLEFLHITRKPRSASVTPWVANTGPTVVNGPIDPSGSGQNTKRQEKGSQLAIRNNVDGSGDWSSSSSSLSQEEHNPPKPHYEAFSSLASSLTSSPPDRSFKQDQPPSYESVFNQTPPITYPSGKVSFSPYVHFGSDGTSSLGQSSQRPLPFPQSASPSAYSDAKHTDLKSSPKVEPQELYSDVEDAVGNAPLEIASVLGLSDDPRVREALQADEEVIAGLLHHVSQSDSDLEEVLALLDDDAQNFLNVVQDVLDRGFFLGDPAEGLKARRLLVKLSSTCYKLPSKLFIEGVELSDAHATFGGGFGDVFRASYKGQAVALKRMRIFQRDPNLPSIRRRFCQEALTWQSLKHAYIVPFLGIVAEGFPTALCLVSPWMRNGTVLKYLADNGRVNVNKRLYEISQGLAYLHSQHIVHGDLRGSNILINDDWQACLTDFGLTVFNDATPATYTSRHEGSVRWMAPELYFPQSFGLDRFRLTPASDIYALGCVCLELYTGRSPFHDIFQDPAIVLKVTEGKRPERPSGSEAMPDELWKLVESCWGHQFNDRPHIDTVVDIMSTLSYPFLQPLHILASPMDILTPIQEKVDLGSQKRVHFDVPDSSGSTTSLGSTSVQTLPSFPSSESFSITTSMLASPTSPSEGPEYYGPESDGSSSATDLFDNDSKDDESTISSTSRDDLDLFFNPQLLVSPRKSRPSNEPRVNYSYGRGIGEAAGIWDLEPECDEQLCWDISLLSAAALCLRTRIMKYTNVRNGVSYPSSFNGKDIIATLRVCIEEEHDDTDSPLPLESLVLDIARSLQRQFLFCEVGSLEWGDSEETVYHSEERIYRFLDDQDDSLSTNTEDEVPTGVIPMLTHCYSPTCSDDWPCFSHACPRWGKAQPSQPESSQPATVGSKMKPSGAMIPSTRPADITLLLDRVRDTGRTPHPVKSVPDNLLSSLDDPVRPQVASTGSEGDLLDNYWQLTEKMDTAFDTKFELKQFSQEVIARVDSIADSSHHSEPLRFQYKFKWVLALCMSFPLAYLLSLNLPSLLDCIR
ncbi:hypothetical protein F5146DRAFT_1140510 [Armillaria mellea]|nr:hypothetical protein F5146DRAFT_1140510 [Armillaria mellea]